MATRKIDLKAWEPEDEAELTPGVTNQIVWQIREGEHDPAQARRLLQLFLERTERGRPEDKIIPAELLEFLRHAFGEYLKDAKEGRLERLLGLVRAKKRPKIKEREHHQIAWDVLRERLEDKSLHAAAATVGESWHLHESRVQDIWAKHKHFALDLETYSRIQQSDNKKSNWTDSEKERLKRIYGKYILDTS